MGQLRRVLAAFLNEDAWPPGRWDPTEGRPMDDDDKERLGDPLGLPEVVDEEDTLAEDIRSFFLQEDAPPVAGSYAPFDMERDHTGRSSAPWYRSPGRAAGGDGDPGRPADPHAYLGMHPPSAQHDPTAAPPAASGEAGTAARLAPPIWQLSAGSDTSKVLGANARSASPGVPSEDGSEEDTGAPGEHEGEEATGAGEAQRQEQDGRGAQRGRH